MKYLISLLVVCLGAGCASRKEAPDKVSTTVPGTSVSGKKMASVRTPEVVKAYPVGRYSDPNYPEEMHERHTVYRREQSPDWNYLPDPPVEMPMGPSAAKPQSSQSYYAKAEGELNSQQRAYAEALQEQNRAMKQRIDSLQKEAGKVPELQLEIDRLKKRIDEPPASPSAPTDPQPATGPDDDVFSSAEPELPAWENDQSDPGAIASACQGDNSAEDFLLSQMRINDDYAAALAAAERRQLASVINRTRVRPVGLAFFKP